MEHKEDGKMDAGTSVDDVDSDDDDMAVAREVIEGHTLDELKASLLLGARDLTRSTLKSKLTKMWTTYLSNASSTSVTDFLSVRHLGYIFEQLAQLGRSLAFCAQLLVKLTSIICTLYIVYTFRVHAFGRRLLYACVKCVCM